MIDKEEIKNQVLKEKERQAAEGFNVGSDARIAGILPTKNPYQFNDLRHYWWGRGWRHVDANWGIYARWPIRRLPKLAENFSPKDPFLSDSDS